MAAPKNPFDQVGARDIHCDRIEEHEVKELNGAYCPCCHAGPMDGVTGLRFNTVKPPSGPWDVVDIQEDDFEPVYPKHGMPTVCSYCGELCAFQQQGGDKLSIVYPSDSDIADWKSDVNVWRVLEAAQKFFKQKALEGRLSGNMKYVNTKPKRF